MAEEKKSPEDRAARAAAARARAEERKAAAQQDGDSAETEERKPSPQRSDGSPAAEEKKPAPARQSSAAKATEARSQQDDKQEDAEAREMNRREFMTYAWGATLGFLMLQGGVASFMFALPRFREGEFGGVFDIGRAANLPQVGNVPAGNPDGRFWEVMSEDGYYAIYMVCTHLGCLYAWEDFTGRFECPCHGSKFTREGRFIEGPAPRWLDQFEVHMLDAEGNVLEATPGPNEPTPVPSPDAIVHVDTGRRIEGRRV